MFNHASIYYFEGSARYELVKAVVNYCNLNQKIEFKKVSDYHADFVKLFPQQKIPAFYEEEDDFALTEVIAIAYYVLSLGQDNQKENTLAGVKNKDKATILKWMSFFNQEVFPAAAAIFYANLKIGKKIDVGNQKNIIEKNIKNLETVLIPQIENQINAKDKYLSHLNHITICDIFGVLAFKLMFISFYGEAWRNKHANITNWYNKVMANDYLSHVNKTKLLEKNAEFVKD